MENYAKRLSLEHNIQGNASKRFFPIIEMKECFEKDYNDLSDKTKEMFREKYELILRIVIKN